MENEDKLRQIELAKASLERDFGKGIIMNLDDEDYEVSHIEKTSTGIMTLDMIIGGGLPLGRAVEIYGPESSGKSTFALSVVAEAQSNGLVCAYIDVEHAVDPSYARALGCNLSELIFSQPDSGENAIDIMLRLVESGAVKVIVIDSVADLVPQAELDGAMDDSQMAALPRLMSKAMRKLTGPAAKNGVLLLFINQIRSKVGIVFGNPEITPGGFALRFGASIRIELRKVKDIKGKNEGDVIGVRTKATVKKNKMAPPYRTAEFDIIFGRGVNRIGSLLDLAELRGVVIKSGSWYSYGDQKNVAQGRDRAVEWLASDLELAEKIKQEVMNTYE